MKIDKKRKRQRKTNYTKRLILLKGKLPRLVVRKTNRYLIAQVIESNDAEDKVLYSTNSKELLKLGWPENKKGSLKSLTAGYLTGLLLGKKAKGLKKRIILDTGLIPSTKGSRVYAVTKGFSDAGADIKFQEEIIPTKEKIEDKEFKEFFNTVKQNIGGGK